MAAAAHRAGRRALVLDLFNDVDTRQLAWRSDRIAGSLNEGLDDQALINQATAILGTQAQGETGIVYGAGFEDRPGLLCSLARRFTLLGNRPEVVEEVKDPRRFFGRLRDLDISHPEVRFTRPTDLEGWLAKRTGASGGWHVRHLPSAVPATAEDYYQRHVDGRSVSALFLGNGSGAKVLGVSEQWRAAGLPGMSFAFGGAVQPALLPPDMADEICRVTTTLAATFGLVGLNSADFLVRDDGFDVLEVNPRPGATLDIFDLDPMAPLFSLHEAACSGDLPKRWRPRSVAKACALVYAPFEIGSVAACTWPDWAVDRPRPGTAIAAGAPVCTLLAEAATATRARTLVRSRVDYMLRWLDAGGLAGSTERVTAAPRGDLAEGSPGIL